MIFDIISDLFKKKKKIPMPWAKFYREEELNFKIPDISIYDQIKNSAEKYSDYYAYEYLGKKVKYKKLMKQVNIASVAFKKLGIRKGDIVNICLPNLPEAIISVYALNRMGAIAKMIHPLSAEQEIKESLISTKSKYLIMTDMFYSKIKDVIHSTGVKKVIFVSAANSMKFYMKLPYKIMNIGKFEKYKRSKKFISWTEFYLSGLNGKNIKFKHYGKNTPAVILHSGGTSGKPKNVVLQNRAFVMSAIQEEMVFTGMHPEDSVIAIMPNFHGFGLSVCMHSTMVLGFKSILVPQFDSKKFDVLFNKTKPSAIVGVPTLYEALTNNNNIKNLDLSFLKYAISGGDLLPKKLEDRVNEYFESHNSQARITQGYGLTEALAAVCLGHDDINKSGSIGIPLPGNLMKIIDPATRKTLPYGEIGEICIHTRALMMGYLNDESETNMALQMHDDGYIWLHTGDLGYMDDEGFIFYKGRQKRMIICSGYNVFPAHVEEVIESHPAVLQCSVVGMPHPYKQEVPKAFIILKEGFHGLFIKNEIKEFCKKNLEHHAIPYKFVYRKQLPKTKVGKVDFRKLMEDNGEDDDE